MGDLVFKEKLLDPTCGAMYEKYRYLLTNCPFSHGSFYSEGILVGIVYPTNVELNGSIVTDVAIIEKRPNYSVPGDISSHIGVNNGIAIIQETLVGLEKVDGVWVARRELRDDEGLFNLVRNYI